MKVCHFISSVGLGRGEVYIDLANALCSKVEIALLIPKGALYRDRIHADIEVIEYLSKDTRRNPFLLIEIARKLKDLKLDIVHTHFAKATEIFLLVNKFLQLSHVATKHNPRKGKVFNKAPHVIAVSDIVKQSIKQENVQVIHNGITPIDLPPRTKESEIFSMLAIGRLAAIKGFDCLIKELSTLEFHYKLTIIGDGPEKGNLEGLIRELALQDKIELAGFRTDIPERIRDADLIIMSSHSEGAPIVALEALFYGRLFVSTAVGNIPKILPLELQLDLGRIAQKITAIHADYDKYRDIFNQLKEKHQGSYLLKNIAEEHITYYRQIRS